MTRRWKSVYRVLMFDGLKRFVHGWVLHIEDPVEHNLKTHIQKWRALNPWARIASYRYKFMGSIETTNSPRE